jgi:hypothetical protein
LRIIFHSLAAGLQGVGAGDEWSAIEAVAEFESQTAVAGVLPEFGGAPVFALGGDFARDDLVVVPAPVVLNEATAVHDAMRTPIALAGICELPACERLAKIQKYLKSRARESGPASQAGRARKRCLSRAGWATFRTESPES